jgi:hypothetical protein
MAPSLCLLDRQRHAACQAALEVLEGLTAPEYDEIESWLDVQLRAAIEAAATAKEE